MPKDSFFLNCRPNDTTSKRAHLETYVGDTLLIRLVINDNGTPVDITGGYFWWTVKDDINDTDNDAIFLKETGSGITTPRPDLGQVVIALEPSETIALRLQESKSYYWDLQYQDNEGNVSTLASGKLKILLGVTGNAGYIVGVGDILSTTRFTGTSIGVLGATSDVVAGASASLTSP